MQEGRPQNVISQHDIPYPKKWDWINAPLCTSNWIWETKGWKHQVTLAMQHTKLWITHWQHEQQKERHRWEAFACHKHQWSSSLSWLSAWIVYRPWWKHSMYTFPLHMSQPEWGSTGGKKKRKHSERADVMFAWKFERQDCLRNRCPTASHPVVLILLLSPPPPPQTRYGSD